MESWLAEAGMDLFIVGIRAIAGCYRSMCYNSIAKELLFFLNGGDYVKKKKEES